MEAFISKRICQACLGHIRASSLRITKISRPSTSVRIGQSLYGGQPSRCLTASYRLYCSKAGEPGDGKTKAPPSSSADPPFIHTAKKAQPGQSEQKESYQKLIDEINKRDQKLEEEKGNKKGIKWKPLVLLGGTCLAIYMYVLYLKKQKELAIAKKRSVSLGKAALGGDWELVNQDGKTMTNKDFLGQWTVLYFGFTHCPDICPDELDKLVSAVNIVDSNPKLPNVAPLFITVDQERDTKEVIKDYLSEFSPKLIGFTGSKDQIDQATRAFRVYFSMGPKDEDNDYIVDHTIMMYLVNPDGEFTDYFGRDKTMIQVARGIEKRMVDYEKVKKS